MGLSGQTERIPIVFRYGEGFRRIYITGAVALFNGLDFRLIVYSDEAEFKPDPNVPPNAFRTAEAELIMNPETLRALAKLLSEKADELSLQR